MIREREVGKTSQVVVLVEANIEVESMNNNACIYMKQKKVVQSAKIDTFHCK